MERANQELRKRITEAGLFHWQVAEAVGVSESTFCRWMRKAPDPERLRTINEAIAKLASRRKE